MSKSRPPSLQEFAGHRDAICALAERHGAVAISVVGSVARGSAGVSSDVDFLLEMAPQRTLFDVGALQLSLEELIGRRVHLSLENGLSTTERAVVRRDARRL